MRNNQIVDFQGGPTFVSSVGAGANQAVTITIAAVATEKHVLDWVQWSYSAAGAGSLSITVDGTTVMQLDITAAGPGSLDLSAAPIYGAINEAVVITLAAVTGAVGKLNCRYR